jgi:phage terminase large subunit-like protein
LLSESDRAKLFSDLDEETADSILWDWRWNGRPNQILPGTRGASETRTDWLLWLCLAGRGWGKTRVGAEAVREWAEDPNARILMIAPTVADVRDVMIEGPSGLLQCYPSARRPIFTSSRHLVEFPSGAVGITRSADEPERLRGPQFTKFWADEICAWNYPKEAFDQIMFGFRVITPDLRGIITTTPKPIKTLKEIVAAPDTVITRGSSYENRANLSERYYSRVIAPYEGTRLGRQEIHAQILEDVPGALWTRSLLDATRIHAEQIRRDRLVRTIIAIDPAVTHRENSDETGIVVLALTDTMHVLVLRDLSCRESVLGWAKVAVAAYRYHQADRIVCEVNNGGDLVEANIRGVDPNIAVRAVRASRGKYIRAEPVSALYEQGRVHHVGMLEDLEDQMCEWTPQGNEPSPDRLDALVWGVTELLIDNSDAEMQVQFSQPYRITI